MHIRFTLALALSAGNLIKALVLTAVCGPIAAVVVVPVRGRPAARWLWHLLLFQLGMVFGWTRWQSKAAAGQSNDPGEPDLPGSVFAGVPLLEGVVARHRAAERQPPPLCGHRLDLAAQVDLCMQEFVARKPVLA